MMIHTSLLRTGLFIAAGLFLAGAFIGPRIVDNANVTASEKTWSDQNNVVEERRDLTDFNQINVSDGINLFLTQGDQEKVTVRTEARFLNQVSTTVRNRVLYIEVKGRIYNAEALDVLVTVEDLRELHASGGSDVFADDGLRAEEFSLYCSGGSDTRLRIEAGRLYCKSSGGSDANLSGNVDELVVESSGGSDFNAKDLQAVNANITSSGASDAWIHATGEVTLRASDASDIHVKGDPKVIEAKASGGADIHY